MKEHRLCPSCIQEGLTECWYETRFKKRIKALPPTKNQTPVAEGAMATKEAHEVDKANFKDRAHARDKRLCPNVNFYPINSKFQSNL